MGRSQDPECTFGREKSIPLISHIQDLSNSAKGDQTQVNELWSQTTTALGLDMLPSSDSICHRSAYKSKQITQTNVQDLPEMSSR